MVKKWIPHTQRYLLSDQLFVSVVAVKVVSFLY